MQGIMFTEFLEMVEKHFSIDIAEDVLERSHLESNGVYTSVGTYDYRELLELTENLAEVSGLPESGLIMMYGTFLFSQFVQRYPELFEGTTCAIDFLETINTRIQNEVRKLYPDAQLPNFETARIGDASLDMIYRSSCSLADLAEALIAGCIEHFGSKSVMTREDDQDEGGFFTRFNIRCRSEVTTCLT